MRRSPVLLVATLAILFAALPLTAQKLLPKSIQFVGAPEYPDQDLLAAAQLTPGQPLTSAEMAAHAQLLIDSGVFDNLTYKFDGQNLVFNLVPSTQLFPIRLDNLPIEPGPGLDAKLHAQFPLYHGMVPADGKLLSGVRQSLEQMLLARGLEATVKAVPFTDPVAQKITQMDFSILIPPVVLGEVRLDAASPAPAPEFAAGLHEILSRLSGVPYDRQGSPNQIETGMLNYYRDRGFLDCAVHTAPQAAVEPSDRAILVPFQVSVAPGVQYRIAAFELAPGLAVSQADFDRQPNLHPGDIADGARIRASLEWLAHQYHDTGHVRAQTSLAPTYDRAHATVRYTVNIDPGPVYTMGRLAIENVSGQLRGEILASWKMAPGSAFNESAIMDYFSDRKLSSDLKRTFAVANVKYILHIDDTAKSVGVELILQPKPENKH
jgi:outer membrane protein assembly factor BamA